jgi:hypothetical protein
VNDRGSDATPRMPTGPMHPPECPRVRCNSRRAACLSVPAWLQTGLTAPRRWQQGQGAYFGLEPAWRLWRKWLGGSGKRRRHHQSEHSARPCGRPCGWPPPAVVHALLARTSDPTARLWRCYRAMSLAMTPAPLTPEPLTPLPPTPAADTKSACMPLPAVRAGGKSVDPGDAVPWTRRPHTSTAQWLRAGMQGRFASTDLFLKRQQLLLACTEGLPSPRHLKPVTRDLSTRARRCMFHVKLMPGPTEATPSQFGLLGVLDFID